MIKSFDKYNLERTEKYGTQKLSIGDSYIEFYDMKDTHNLVEFDDVLELRDVYDTIGEECVYIDKIYIDPKDKNKYPGLLRRFFKEVEEYTRKSDTYVTIVLVAEPFADKRKSVQELIEIYKYFGFVPYKWKNGEDNALIMYKDVDIEPSYLREEVVRERTNLDLMENYCERFHKYVLNKYKDLIDCYRPHEVEYVATYSPRMKYDDGRGIIGRIDHKQRSLELEPRMTMDANTRSFLTSERIHVDMILVEIHLQFFISHTKLNEEEYEKVSNLLDKYKSDWLHGKKGDPRMGFTLHIDKKIEFEQDLKHWSTKRMINLNESKNYGILYHFTSIHNLISMLKNYEKEKKIYLATNHTSDRANNNPVVSLTRNPSMNSADLSLNKQVCRITLDGEKLSRKYKMSPYADWQYTDWSDDEQEEMLRIKKLSDYEKEQQWAPGVSYNIHSPDRYKGEITDCILRIDILTIPPKIKKTQSYQSWADSYDKYNPRYLGDKEAENQSLIQKDHDVMTQRLFSYISKLELPFDIKMVKKFSNYKYQDRYLDNWNKRSFKANRLRN